MLRGVLLRAAAWRAGAGLALGFGGAVSAGWLVKSVLFGIGADDAMTYGIVLIVVAAAVSLAAPVSA